MQGTQQSDHERQKKKKSIDITVTSGRCLIDAPLLRPDRNRAITRAHCFLLVHKSRRSQDKECDTESRREGEKSCEPGLITAKVPEEERVGEVEVGAVEVD